MNLLQEMQVEESPGGEQQKNRYNSAKDVDKPLLMHV